MAISFPILGHPTSMLRQIPAVVEEESAGHLLCISRSTTVPATHNLTMEISWYIDGQYIKTADRFRVAYNELSIYFMSRADKNLVVLCEAHEQYGLTSWANITMQINCKLINFIKIVFLLVKKWKFKKLNFYFNCSDEIPFYYQGRSTIPKHGLPKTLTEEEMFK